MRNMMSPDMQIDKTLSVEGVPADAKSVGGAVADIKTNISLKINLATNIGYCHMTGTANCDLSILEDGDYLIIAPRSSFVSAFSKTTSGVAFNNNNMSVSGNTLTIKNLQWYTSVHAIKIFQDLKV